MLNLNDESNGFWYELQGDYYIPYLMHLYRQNVAEEVHKKINAISSDKEFLEICDYYDKNAMPCEMGSFRRAGIFAVAEKANG